MNIRNYASVVLVALGLAGCAAPGPQPGEVEIRRGVIEQITAVQIASNQHQGVGAVVGGLAGLGIGSLIGGGTGRDVAMVVGTIGGALAGNEVQKRNDQPVQGQQIIVAGDERGCRRLRLQSADKTLALTDRGGRSRTRHNHQRRTSQSTQDRLLYD